MSRPTKEQAQAAVTLLLKYIGEDPNREGIKDTPARVIKSYQELFSGYQQNIETVLNKKFMDICQYQDAVLLKNISFESLCEHHMLPFIGTVDLAYIPDQVVLGISKLARLVDMFAKRLQVQERMTASIAQSLQDHLQPKGVAIRVNAKHSCMAIRGTLKSSSVMETSHFTGVYQQQPALRQEFWQMLKS